MTRYLVRELEFFDDEEATGVIFEVDPPEGEETGSEIACFRPWKRQRGRSKKERGPWLNIGHLDAPILSIEISEQGRQVMVRAVSLSLELDLSSAVAASEERLVLMRFALNAIAENSRCEVVDHDGTPTDDGDDPAWEELAPEHRDLFDIMNPVVEADEPGEHLLEALPKLRALVAREPRFIPAKVALGATLSELGRHDEALPHLLAAANGMTGDRCDSAALGILAEALGELDRHEEALHWHHRRLEHFPGDQTAISDYFGTLKELGREEEILREADRLDTPELRDFLFVARGDALFGLGRFDDAIGWFRKFERQHPRDPQIHLSLAQTYLAREDLAKARKACERAEELLAKADLPEFLPFIVILGILWKGIGDMTGVKRIEKKLRRFDPEMADALLK